MDYNVFTVCNLAYLPKALVLADSFYEFNSKKITIFLFDKKQDLPDKDINAEIIWVEDLRIPNFKQLAFKYDIIEFSTSLKPFISLKLLEKYDSVIFFDPDICLYHSVEPILADLENHSIVLTPHHTTPQSDDLSESDTAMMRFGSFNLGFYAVNKSEQGLYFLKWWSQRCLDFSYTESQFGLSTDQKWVSIAPCFFEDIHVSFNLGYNVAPWNSWERKIKKDELGQYWVNDQYPLIFFHFSNFNSSDPGYMDKRSCYEKNIFRPDFLELGEEYAKKLSSKGSSSVRYSFDYMSGGEYISPTLRQAYACILTELPLDHDPFDSAGVVGTFARKNFLLEKGNHKYTRESFNKLSENGRKLKLIYFFMRILMRLFGPNKFQSFSRLLVYLSSYRRNRGLWKL